MTRLIRIPLLAALTFGAVPAFANPNEVERVSQDKKEDNEGPFSVSAEVNLGYDYALYVDETDTGSTVGDAFLETEIGVEWRALGKAKGPSLELAYDYSRTDYRDITDFSIQSHRLGAVGRAEVGPIDLSLGYNFSKIDLAGDPLLNLHIVTPTASFKLNKRTIGLLTYSFTRKDFSTLNDRDADSHQVTATVIRLLDLKGSYVYGGIGLKTETATDIIFDYKSVRFNLSGKKAQPFGITKAELSASVAYERANYSAFNPLVPGLRRDRDFDFEVEAAYTLMDNLSAHLRFERNVSNSTFDFARFKGKQISAGVRVEF